MSVGNVPPVLRTSYRSVLSPFVTSDSFALPPLVMGYSERLVVPGVVPSSALSGVALPTYAAVRGTSSSHGYWPVFDPNATSLGSVVHVPSMVISVPNSEASDCFVNSTSLMPVSDVVSRASEADLHTSFVCIHLSSVAM